MNHIENKQPCHEMWLVYSRDGRSGDFPSWVPWVQHSSTHHFRTAEFSRIIRIVIGQQEFNSPSRRSTGIAMSSGSSDQQCNSNNKIRGGPTWHGHADLSPARIWIPGRGPAAHLFSHRKRDPSLIYGHIWGLQLPINRVSLEIHNYYPIGNS